MTAPYFPNAAHAELGWRRSAMDGALRDIEYALMGGVNEREMRRALRRLRRDLRGPTFEYLLTWRSSRHRDLKTYRAQAALAR